MSDSKRSEVIADEVKVSNEKGNINKVWLNMVCGFLLLPFITFISASPFYYVILIQKPVTT